METSLLITLLVGLFGGGTAGVVFRSIYDHKCKEQDDRDELKADIKWLKNKSTKRDIEVAQLKILNLIQHCPKDHKAITMELDHYFLVLKEDSWVFNYARAWANDEGVDISYLSQIHEENVKRTKGGKYA